MRRIWIVAALISLTLVSAKEVQKRTRQSQETMVKRTIKPRLIDINRYRRPDVFYNKRLLT